MIFAANFKTNLNRGKSLSYYKVLSMYKIQSRCSDELMIFPPQSALMGQTTDVVVGAQNAYACESGAFTGEIGVEQLSEFNIKTIMIGHSERRHILHESQDEIAKKFAFFKEQGFRILYCVGEPIETRKEGTEALKAYIEAQFSGIDLAYEQLIVAYEPVWAIGTDVTPSVQEIANTHAMIRQFTAQPLLYGGSVKPKNAAELVAIENVDGLLVGSASLKIDDFKAIIEAKA